MKGRSNAIRSREDGESYVDYYLDFQLHEGSTEDGYYTAWGHLEDFVEREGLTVEEVGLKEAIEFCEYLKARDIGEVTAEMYVLKLSNLVTWLIEKGEADHNPYASALAKGPFEYDKESTQRRVPIDELKKAIQDTGHPFTLTLVVLLLKTGIRIAEATNLDYRDVHLDHPIAETMDEPREEIGDKPDSIYIDSSISAEQTHNGEKRMDGNKPNSYRAIPIDEELKRVLVWYIALTPPSPSKANPLLRQTNGFIGKRYSTEVARNKFNEWSANNDWHAGEQKSTNVSPHWCRHWFSTTLRQRIPSEEVLIGEVKDYVGALRGDTDSRTVDTYTHDWSEKEWIREAYLNNVPKLLTNA
ncbi:site-specific integrase [Halobacteria archaeon AArc-m2/3/4]|uniref:Site-specific integrase n=1 Tax=Natronoglomus mannanivorans TaxID=2979990 RepID=A0ABT2QM87_9EURY|nr:site-specific integrase [Halobacteria archaeon AArc-m2/3/4]